MHTYNTITGVTIPLSRLTRKELEFLDKVVGFYETKPEWTNFAARWVYAYAAAELDTNSSVLWVCQDMEARLGIAQGKVAKPGCIDAAVERIKEKYGSPREFCAATGIPLAVVMETLLHPPWSWLKNFATILGALDAELGMCARTELPTNDNLKEAILNTLSTKS